MYWEVHADRVASIGPWMCIDLESTMRSRLQVTSLAPLPRPASDGAAILPLRERRLESLSNPLHLRPHLNCALLRCSMFRLQWNEEGNSRESRQDPGLHELPWSEESQPFFFNGYRAMRLSRSERSLDSLEWFIDI